MKRLVLAGLSAGLMFTTVPAAFAYDAVGHDIRSIQQDRARLRNDYNHLNQERRALWGAEAREGASRWFGNWWGVRHAEHQESRDLNAIGRTERQIANDRAELSRDRVDLRRDVGRYW